MADIIRDTWLRRNLLRELVVRDLKLRYSQPFLGFVWAFLTPFLTTVVFYLIFSLFLKVRVVGVPFFLYLASAIFGWGFFQDSLLGCCGSLVNNRNILKETKIPHYLIPLAICLANFVNFLPSLVVVIILSVFVLKGLSFFILFLPVILVLHLFYAFGLGLTLAVIYVRWRDLRYLTESVLLLIFYITPIVYPLDYVHQALPGQLFLIYNLNPFVGVVNVYRICLMKGFYKNIVMEKLLFTNFIWPFVFAFFCLGLGFYSYFLNKDKINDYLAY